MDEQSGAVSPGGRFDRMEASLARIEQKLDTKVSHEDFKLAIDRITALESGNTPLGKVLLRQFETTQSLVQDLTLHGSQHTQDAAAKIGKLEGQVDVLEAKNVAQDTLSEARREEYKRRDRAWRVALTIVSLLALLVAATSLVSHLP